jgi:hypothetical protein
VSGDYLVDCLHNPYNAEITSSIFFVLTFNYRDFVGRQAVKAFGQPVWDWVVSSI